MNLPYEIEIDYTRDQLLSEDGMATLRDRYMVPGEKSPQEAFARAACAFASNKKHAQRLYDYASKLWFGFASPLLSNGGTDRGLPISCFLNYMDDSIKGITDTMHETAYLTVKGGGVGTYMGALRPDESPTSTGNKATGAIPHIKVIDSMMNAFSQGSTRRGASAVYMDIGHSEIEEFITVRKIGGDMNRKSLNLHNAVIIPDVFMRAVDNDIPWNLIDPHTREVTKTVSARELWIKILETRVAVGEPYIMFDDTVNRSLPEEFKKYGLRVHQSNLCSEITLPTSPQRTAVCCLSSVNLERYYEWNKEELFIQDLVEMLDNCLDVFIKAVMGDAKFVTKHGNPNKIEYTGTPAIPAMIKAAWSAFTERSIGLGAMGLHSLYQSKNIPFESALAASLNKRVFKHIKDKAVLANMKLGKERGSPMILEGSGKRLAHLMAVAPNATSGIICGSTSPSIEPLKANAFTQKTKSGSFLRKNKFLEKALTKLNMNTEEVWSSIITNKGSVQHLDIPEDIKEVFKTFSEIDMHWVVQQGADRQEFICQAQSLNIFIDPKADKAYVHSVHWDAWKKGCKCLYYARSESIRRAEKVTNEANITETQFEKQTSGECLACEG